MINEILLSIIMACSLVVDEQVDSCRAYIRTCYEIQSKNYSYFPIIEQICYNRIANIYDLKTWE